MRATEAKAICGVMNERIAVAALEADLLLGANAGVLELAPARRATRHRPAASTKLSGWPPRPMDSPWVSKITSSTSAKPRSRHHVGQPQPQPLDRDRRRRLAQMPAGVGKAGLDAEPAALLGHRRGSAGSAGTASITRLPRSNALSVSNSGEMSTLAVDPEQLGEIERRQQRQRRFRTPRSGSAPAWWRRCISASAPRS